MERYIKANRKVVEFLQLTEDRTELPDGNFILWCQDIMPLGDSIVFQETLSKIGAIAMDGKTACMEQEGEVCNKLPVATDSRFIMREEAKNE